MRSFLSLGTASAAIDNGEIEIGATVQVGDERYTLESIDAEGPQWRPLQDSPIFEVNAGPRNPRLFQVTSLKGVAGAYCAGNVREGDDVVLPSGDRWTVGAPAEHYGQQYLTLTHTGTGNEEFVLLDAPDAPAPAPAPTCAVRESRTRTLPDDDDERKATPLARGCLLYFPAALVEVARVSHRGNEQHNPGEPIHWARGKSMDQVDTLLRHVLDACESKGETRLRHLAAAAWRALAELQIECEAQGAPLAPSAKEPRS